MIDCNGSSLPIELIDIAAVNQRTYLVTSYMPEKVVKLLVEILLIEVLGILSNIFRIENIKPWTCKVVDVFIRN